MNQVIICNKSLNERFDEYTELFKDQDSFSLSAMTKIWSVYLELAIDPNGWQAVWKIPRATCEQFNIPFPSYALVIVLDVDFDRLHATVRIIAVLDDIHLPEKRQIPIIELWPTKDQDTSIILNVNSTAEAIDTVRFFYNHLFFPWDYEMKQIREWKVEHLENRLRLYYDTKTGTLPRNICDHINSLISEARNLQITQDRLVSEASEEDEEIDEIIYINLRFLEIKTEIEKWANPLYRIIMLKRYEEESVNRKEKFSGVALVLNSENKHKIQDVVKMFEEMEQLSPEINVFNRLEECFQFIYDNSTFILSPDRYIIKSVVHLGGRGVLKGLRDFTVLVSELQDMMFDFYADDIIFENLTINANISRVIGVLRQGKVTFKNCKLFGDGNTSTRQGLIVLNGSTLELTDCQISCFNTAIVANSGSRLVINNCDIYKSGRGIKIFDGSSVWIKNSRFFECSEYAICLETEKDLEGEGRMSKGDFELLKLRPEISMELVSGTDNLKGNVLINNPSKINPMDDLFKNEDLTLLVNEDDEKKDEMEVCDVPSSPNVSPVTV